MKTVKNISHTEGARSGGEHSTLNIQHPTPKEVRADAGLAGAPGARDGCKRAERSGASDMLRLVAARTQPRSGGGGNPCKILGINGRQASSGFVIPKSMKKVLAYCHHWHTGPMPDGQPGRFRSGKHGSTWMQKADGALPRRRYRAAGDGGGGAKRGWRIEDGGWPVLYRRTAGRGKLPNEANLFTICDS